MKRGRRSARGPLAAALAAFCVVPPCGGGRSGCGCGAIGPSDCTEPFCPRFVPVPSSKTGGVCVRGLFAGEECELRSDCQLSTCVVAGKPSVTCPKPVPNGTKCICAGVSVHRDVGSAVAAGVLAGCAFGTMFIPLRNYGGPNALSPQMQALVFAGGWFISAVAALVRPATAIVHLIPSLGGAALPASHVLLAGASHLLGVPRAAAWWAAASLLVSWAVGVWAPLELPRYDGYDVSWGCGGLCLACLAMLVVFRRAEVSGEPAIAAERRKTALAEAIPLVGTTAYAQAAVPTPANSGNQSFASTLSTDADAAQRGPRGSLTAPPPLFAPGRGPPAPNPQQDDPAQSPLADSPAIPELDDDLFRSRARSPPGPPPPLQPPPPPPDGCWKVEQAQLETAGWGESDSRLSPCARRLLGAALCAAAGVLQGLSMAPVSYMTANWDRLTADTQQMHSRYGVDYGFSVLTGALAGAVTTAAVLSAVRDTGTRDGGVQQGARGVGRSAAPALLSGALWGAGLMGLAHGVGHAGLAVAVPVASCVAPAIATFWSAVVCRDISELPELSYAAGGAILCVAAACCFALAA